MELINSKNFSTKEVSITVCQTDFCLKNIWCRLAGAELAQGHAIFIDYKSSQTWSEWEFLCGFVFVCVFFPLPFSEGTLLIKVPGTPIGASFFEFELKPTGKDSADPTQHEFQHHIL